MFIKVSVCYLIEAAETMEITAQHPVDPVLYSVLLDDRPIVPGALLLYSVQCTLYTLHFILKVFYFSVHPSHLRRSYLRLRAQMLPN